MRSGLLRGGVGVCRARDASGGAASSWRAGRGVLAAEREPLRAEGQIRDAVAHVLLQRVKEAHCWYAWKKINLALESKRNTDAWESGQLSSFSFWHVRVPDQRLQGVQDV